MSVSLPGTIVIFTQVSGFAVLNASTMCLSASESGGTWLVQNLTSLAPAAQLAPVIALGWALPPLAAAEAGADADACWAGLGVAAPPQALTTMATTASQTHRIRRADRVIAPPSADAVLLPWSRLG